MWQRILQSRLGFRFLFQGFFMLHIDLVSIEDISAEHIREHYYRLAEFKGILKEEFKS